MVYTSWSKCYVHCMGGLVVYHVTCFSNWKHYTWPISASEWGTIAKNHKICSHQNFPRWSNSCNYAQKLHWQYSPGLSSTGNIDGLMDSVVTPLLKKLGADPEELSNYKPIIKYFGKLIERAALPQLTKHMISNCLHIASQSGYKKKLQDSIGQVGEWLIFEFGHYKMYSTFAPRSHCCFRYSGPWHFVGYSV